MTASRKNEFLARDSYPAWKRRVERARTSIRVVTPYFDAMLGRLFKNSSLALDQIQVLTDLSPESGTQSYRRQLLATRALILGGTEVRSLPRVHAKVLICDDDAVALGSQNFTTYARRSNETTAIPALSLGDSAFLRTIDEWWGAAMVVELEFIELLLADLDEQMRAADEANQTLATEFEQLLQAEQERLAEIERRKSRPIAFDIANVLQSDRVARGVVHARLQYVDWYQSLAVFDSTATLARWIVGRGAEAHTVRLVPTFFYPILLNPSGRMGFARVAKTRITYVRTSGVWNSPEAFGSFSYRMSVSMPAKNTDDHNVRVVLTPVITVSQSSIELHFRFVGDDAELVRSKVNGDQEVEIWGSGRRERRSLDDLCLEITDPAVLEIVVRAALKAGFTYERLGIDNHNANQFFPHDFLQVRLVEFGTQPVLIASIVE